MLINEESIVGPDLPFWAIIHAYCLTNLIPQASGRYPLTRTTLIVYRYALCRSSNTITDYSN